jgi:hypothetical protein
MVAALTLVFSVGCARHPNEQSASGTQEPARAPAVEPANSWVVVQTDFWIPIVDALGGHLHKADEAFDAGLHEEAAVELRRAAAILGEDADESTGEAQSELDRAATDLEAVAKDLERGTAVTAERFDDVARSAWEAEIDHSWLDLEEETWDRIEREPARLLALAPVRLRESEPMAVADLLRQTASYVRIEAGRGLDTADKEALVAAWMDLREMAAELSQGEAPDVHRLETVLARTALAMARHHQLMADHDDELGNVTAAAQSLDTAAEYLEQASSFSGTAIKPGVESAIADARALAESAEDGVPPDAVELHDAMRTIREEIAQLDTTIEPSEARHDLYL